MINVKTMYLNQEIENQFLSLCQLVEQSLDTIAPMGQGVILKFWENC